MLVSPSAIPIWFASVRWVMRAFRSIASSSCRSRCASVSLTESRPGKRQLTDDLGGHPLRRAAVGELALLDDDAPPPRRVQRGVGEVGVDQIHHLAARLRDSNGAAA